MSDFFSPAGARGYRCNWVDWSALVPDGQPRARNLWSAPEAFFCVLFCAATCGGQIAREEQEELLAIAHRSRALKALSDEALAQIGALVVERLRSSDLALTQACAALPPDARAPAFAHALDIVLSDGDLSQDESKFLNALVSYFNMDEKTVRSIADVIIMKNRY